LGDHLNDLRTSVVTTACDTLAALADIIGQWMAPYCEDIFMRLLNNMKIKVMVCE
jgi:hypothetical protein